MECYLAHIPLRLHSKNKSAVLYFTLGEVLFTRCKHEVKNNPFNSFSSYDISVNRQGFDENNIFSEPEDVLFNFSTDEFQKFENETYFNLEIKELNNKSQYEKFSDEYLPTSNKVRIFLNHRIVPCNYSHCCLEIYFNQIEMNKESYPNYLKKDSILKTWCKNELSKMIIRGEVRLNW